MKMFSVFWLLFLSLLGAIGSTCFAEDSPLKPTQSQEIRVQYGHIEKFKVNSGYGIGYRPIVHVLYPNRCSVPSKEDVFVAHAVDERFSALSLLFVQRYAPGHCKTDPVWVKYDLGTYILDSPGEYRYLYINGKQVHPKQ